MAGRVSRGEVLSEHLPVSAVSDEALSKRAAGSFARQRMITSASGGEMRGLMRMGAVGVDGCVV